MTPVAEIKSVSFNSLFLCYELEIRIAVKFSCFMLPPLPPVYVTQSDVEWPKNKEYQLNRFKVWKA